MAYPDLFPLRKTKDIETFGINSKEAKGPPKSELVSPATEGADFQQPPIDWWSILVDTADEFSRLTKNTPIDVIGRTYGAMTEAMTGPQKGISTSRPGLYREAIQRGASTPDITSGAFGESIVASYPKVPWQVAGLIGSIADIAQPGPDDFAKIPASTKMLGALLRKSKIKGVKQLIRNVAGPKEATQLEELATKLRAEQRGVQAGIQLGRRQVRDTIIKEMKQSSTNINNIRKTVMDYASSLPLNQRGKFLPAITRARSARDLISIFNRVDNVLEYGAKADAMTGIKQSYDKLLSSKNIAIDYRDKARNMLSNIDMSKMSNQKKAELSSIMSFLEEQALLGEEVEMPTRIMKQIDRLSKKPLKELTFKELQFIQDELDFLEKVGKTKLRARKNIYKMQKAKAAKELIDGTTSLDKYLETTASFGEELGIGQKFKNAAIHLMSEAQRIDLAITPMDVFFDMLDGAKGTYKGANFKIIKQATDVNFGRYLDLKDSLQRPVIDKGNALGLTRKNYERIGVVAAKEQEGGIKKLLNSGLTQEEIDSVKLTNAEQEWLKTARQTIESVYPKAKQIMKDTYNQPIGKVKEYYPFMTDWKAMDEAEIYQRIGSNAEEFGLPAKNPEMGFTKTRTGVGEQKIKLDAMDIFLNHTDNASYLVEMGPYNRMLYEIINSPEYKAKAGIRGQKMAMEWIDLISRKGGSQGQKSIAILDAIRHGTGLGVLGFKLTSMLIQPTSIVDGASYIGNYAFKGAQNIATDSQWRKLVLQFPEIRTRVGDDPFFTEKGAMEKTRQVAMAGLQALDKFSAMSIAAGAYEKFLTDNHLPLDLNNLNQEAMRYAQFVVRRTQASGAFKDVPLAVSKGILTGNRSVDKAILQFQNFMLNKWSIIRHDIWRSGIKQGNAKKAAQMASMLALGTLAGVGIRTGYNKTRNLITGQDNKDNAFWNSLAAESLQLVPFVGSAISSAMYGSLPVPAIELLSDVTKDIATTIKGKKPITKIKGFARLAMDISSGAGVPGTSEARGWLESLWREKQSYKSKGEALKKKYRDMVIDGKERAAEELWRKGIEALGDKYYSETGKTLTPPSWESIVKHANKRTK